MATSFIQIYAIDFLRVEKNFIIEDIDRFIDEYESIYTIRDFQYIKQSLNLTIKVNLSQANLSANADNLTYLSIKNSDDARIYYYFITNKIWRSENTIEFQLTMDTLNTFKWNDDYSVDKKTLVMREHKDRVKLMEGSSLASPSFERIVHLMSEGINAPLYKVREENIIDKKDTSWSLMYKNKDEIVPTDYNQVNPIECYLMPNNKQYVIYAQGNKVINPADLPISGAYPSISGWFFNPNIQEGIQFKDSNGEIHTMGYPYPRNHWVNFYAIVIQRQSPTTMALARIKYTEDLSGNLQYEIMETYLNLTYVEILNSPSTIKYKVCNGALPSTTSEVYGDDTSEFYWGSIDWSSHQTSSIIDDSFINRTDSKTIKIINLPYCPTNYDVVLDEDDEEGITFAPNWTIDTTNKCLKLNNDTPFSHTIITPSSLNPFDEMVIDYTSEPSEIPSPNQPRKDYMESKIYHSDFYAPKFVYDSFNLTFRCENLDFQKYWEARNVDDEQDGLGFEVNFVMTRNIVSKFLFLFPRYITKYSVMDYDNVVCVSRNNEEVLYTSQYINYLRTGYNYDLKSKERSEIQMGVGLGASAIATLLGVVGGVASQNYGVAVLGAISLATQSIGYAKSIADIESNISQKLEESQRQAISVRNSDDLDLLNAYSNNRAKMCFYEVSPTMKQALLDMFYYCGYTTQEQKVPNVESRYWFNFLQCKLVLGSTCNLPMSIIENIKSKFEEGCTFFHNHNDVWDIEQLKENYETWILE